MSYSETITHANYLSYVAPVTKKTKLINVKIAENTEVTIDLEEFKESLKYSFDPMKKYLSSKNERDL